MFEDDFPWVSRDELISLNPNEFESVVCDWLRAVSVNKNVNVIGKQKINGDSGEYEIDVYAELEIFNGACIKILVECKKYRERVKRDVILALHSKLLETGSHKGIVVATSGFQSGAIEYAKKVGIATIDLIDGRSTYMTRSADNRKHELPPWAEIPLIVGVLIEQENENKWSMSHIDNTHLSGLQKWINS